jgi:hypothetical protein
MSENAPRIAVRTNNPAGEADVVIQGPKNELFYYYATPGSNWSLSTIAPAGSTFSTPDIVVRDNGECDVVALGPNNSLMYYHATPGSPWTSSTVAPANTAFSAPRLVVRPDGLGDIVVQGPQNQLLLFSATPGKPWAKTVVAPAASTYSAPAIALLADGSEVIAAQGPGNQLIYYSARRAAVWSAGNPLFQWSFTPTVVAGNGSTFSDPDIAVRTSNPAGEVDIAVLGSGGKLMYYYLVSGGTWTSTTVAGEGTASSAPSICVRGGNPAGEADIVVLGAKNQILYYHATPGSGWVADSISPTGSAFSAPAISVRDNGEADVVFQGSGGVISYYYAMPGQPWQPSTTTPPPPAPPLPTSKSWGDYVAFSDGTALGGNVTLKIDDKGEFWFSGDMHDSGLAGYSFTLVLVIAAADGNAYAFGTSGQASGHAPWPFSSGSNDYTWNGTPTTSFKDQNGNTITNPNQVLASNWSNIAQGSLGWNITSQNLAAQTLRDFIGDTVKKVLQDGASKGAAALVALL